MNKIVVKFQSIKRLVRLHFLLIQMSWLDYKGRILYIRGIELERVDREAYDSRPRSPVDTPPPAG